MFRKHASDLPEVAAKRRQINAQAKAAKRQSELFQQKEAEAKAAKRESEIYRQKEAEGRKRYCQRWINEYVRIYMCTHVLV